MDLVLQSLQLYRSHVWLMVGYSSWLLLPFTAYFVLSFFPETNPLVFVLEFIFSLVELFLTFWIGIIFILIVNSITEKQTLDTSTIKQKSLALFQPSANALILQFLFVLLGFICLIIPGIMALVWFAFSQTSVVLDNKKGMEAIRYSRSLSKGQFFRVAYRLMGGPIIIGIVYLIIISLVLALSGALSDIQIATTANNLTPPAWINLLQSMIGIFMIPWLATYVTLLYKQLRNETQVDESLSQ